MTPDQKRAIAKADAVIRPAMALYEARNALFRSVCVLPLAEVEALAKIVGRLEERDLIRLARAIAVLGDADLVDAARYIEGLADWAMPEPSSPDGPEKAPPNTG